MVVQLGCFCLSAFQNVTETACETALRRAISFREYNSAGLGFSLDAVRRVRTIMKRYVTRDASTWSIWPVVNKVARNRCYLRWTGELARGRERKREKVKLRQCGISSSSSSPPPPHAHVFLVRVAVVINEHGICKMFHSVIFQIIMLKVVHVQFCDLINLMNLMNPNARDQICGLLTKFFRETSA